MAALAVAAVLSPWYYVGYDAVVGNDAEDTVHTLTCP